MPTPNVKQHTSPFEQFAEFKHERAAPPRHWPIAVHAEVAPPPRIPPPPRPPNCTQHTWVAGSHVEPPQATPPPVDPELPLLDPDPPLDVDSPPLLDPDPPLEVDGDPPPDPDPGVEASTGITEPEIADALLSSS
jgi:hypothetical protein